MKAAIISIGDELLLGQTVNTNASWMGKALAEIGIDTRLVLTIGDTKEEITQALDLTLKQYDFVFMTGGLGPTKDDITKHTVASYFNQKLIVNEAVLKNVRELFAAMNRPVQKINEAQALVPEYCEAVVNKVGTAPGMILSHQRSELYIMPGVPYEMKHLMENEFVPRIIQKFDLPHIISTFILTQGIGESFISEQIEDLEEQLPTHIKLAYLPSRGMVKLRLTGRGANRTAILADLAHHKSLIRDRIAAHVMGEDEELLMDAVAEWLKSNQYTVSTAESCTGGAIAAELTSVPGSSNYFIGGLVTYATSSKTSELGVDPQLIEREGVVSEQVAVEMAMAVRNKFNSDYGIATTGYAGPEGGDDKFPVGTVFIAVAGPDQKTQVQKFTFGTVRKGVVRRAVMASLGMLRRY